MPIHLRAEPGDDVPNVLCPGDPRRAASIAETSFDPGYRTVNQERGMLGFTGTYELADAAARASREHDATVHVGLILSSGASRRLR